MNTAWRRKVRREWNALTGGPLSATWWVTKADLRVAFAEAIFMVLMLLNNDADALSAVTDDEVSVFSLVVLVLATSGYLAITGIVFAVVLLLPSLSRRNETTGRWGQTVTRHRGG